MSVETRPTSRFWYGRWQRKGRRFSRQLTTPVAGESGSPEYDASRSAAEAELAELMSELDRHRRPEDLVQRLHEVKFGKRIGSIPVLQMHQHWMDIPRKRTPKAGHVQFARATIARFCDFLAEHHPKATEMAAVSPEIAEAFMRSEDKRGIAPKTYNAELILLRGVFEKLRIRAGLLANPFRESLVLKDAKSVHREPFTMDELHRLFDVAEKNDPLMYALITVGACTALRRGDACCLKWSDISLTANRIRVATRKTGQGVMIPIFPRLRAVLNALPKTGSPYVFPSLAEDYARDSAALNKRLNQIFALAGFGADPIPAGDKEKALIDIPSEDQIRPRVMARLKALTEDDVSADGKKLLIRIFDAYSSGATLPDIAEDLDLSKSTVSYHIRRIEKIAGHPIVRQQVEKARVHAALITAAKNGDQPVKRDEQPGRLTRVNTRGFHALRATFTTTALTAGVPVEIVRVITGHTLTETVLNHYFNPNEKTVLKTVENAMPRMLTQGDAMTPAEEAIAYVDSLKSDLPTSKYEKLRSLVSAI